MCFPLRTVAFRGHGFSLLALAKGMSMLFAKNGFSRPSLEQFCGVFRLMGLHYRLSHRRPFAIPANVFGRASNRNGLRWDEQCAVPVPVRSEEHTSEL